MFVRIDLCIVGDKAIAANILSARLIISSILFCRLPPVLRMSGIRKFGWKIAFPVKL